MKLLTFILVSVLCGPLTVADTPPKIEGRGSWGKETLGLACRITTDKTEYTIGDRVYLLVEVKNNTSKPIALGLEPLIHTRQRQLARQPAELHTSATQGSPGFFSTVDHSFPKGIGSASRTVVIKPWKSFSEIAILTPWGPNLSSLPTRAQPGEMKIQASLRQFLTHDLKKSQVVANGLILKLKSSKSD